ncbi:hypothetical protein ACFQ9X_55990 [Catenulispora yoronensis]
MIALTIVAVAGVLTRTGRRSPVWRASAVTIGASFAIAVSMELYGRVRSGTPQYYSSKLVESSWVLTLCGIGALGLFLNGQRVSRRAEAALAAASVALPLAVTNGFPMSAHWENHPRNRRPPAPPSSGPGATSPRPGPRCTPPMSGPEAWSLTVSRPCSPTAPRTRAT